MSLFAAGARFSPEVSYVVQDMWVAHGGKVVQTQKDDARYIFCNDRFDPWVASLVRKAIPVFHASWIVDVVRANFPISIVPYILNGAPTRLDITTPSIPKTPARQILLPPSEPPAMLPMKRPFEPQEIPESPEQPRKKARLMPVDSGIIIKDIRTVAATKSRVKLVDDAPIKVMPDTPRLPRKARKHKSVPHIDLSQTSSLHRKSSLDIQLIKKSVPASSHNRSLVFQVDGVDIPRISLSVALDALDDISTDSCALLAPNAYHDGKQFRCDLALRP